MIKCGLITRGNFVLADYDEDENNTFSHLGVKTLTQNDKNK